MTKDLIVEDFEILPNCSVDKLLKLKHVSQDYVRETVDIKCKKCKIIDQNQ